MSEAFTGKLTPHQVLKREAIKRVLALQLAACSFEMSTTGLSNTEAIAVVTETMLQAATASAYELTRREGRVPDKALWLGRMDALFDEVARASLKVGEVQGHG